MIEKLLNKFGYVKGVKATYEYHITEAAKYLGDPTDFSLTKEVEEDFFKDLSQIPNVGNFLDATLAADMQREFSCTEENQRHLVKGAFGRTLYFKKGIKKVKA